MTKPLKPLTAHYLLQIGDVVIDMRGREVQINGHHIVLTRTEFDVLLFLCEHHEWALTKQQIIDAIWEIDAEVNYHAVENVIYKIRKKISYSENVQIRTLTGYGHKLTTVSHE